MAREFEIRREIELPAAPEQVWAAVATSEGTAAWLWPMEIQPEVGGVAEAGSTTVWDPPHRFTARAEGEGGWFNQLELHVDGRPGGTAILRYVHSGIFTDNWESQYDGAAKHTDFYLHTLSQYLQHFPGQRAKYASADAPESSASATALDTLRKSIGVGDATVGDAVRIEIPGLPAVAAVVDYANPYFLGLRTDFGLLRVFGRGPFQQPLSVSLHLFDDGVDTTMVAAAWQGYLADLYS